MLELLSSEYAIIQELGLRTVDNCMLDTQCRATFRQLGGLEKVVEFIGNKVSSTDWCMASGRTYTWRSQTANNTTYVFVPTCIHIWILHIHTYHRSVSSAVVCIHTYVEWQKTYIVPANGLCVCVH